MWFIGAQFAAPALAASYSVEGTISYEIQRPEKPSTPYVRGFKLLFDDCGWKITVPLGPTNPGSYVCQYDTTNLTSYVVESKGGTNIASGIVEDSEVPQIWLSAAAEYVWLAFASSCYFEHATNGRALSLMPLLSPSGLCRRYDVPVRLKLSPSPPKLPIEVAYITDKLLFLNNNGTTDTVPLPAAFKEGYVGAELKSSGFSNVDGLSFPTHFEYKMYGPLPEAKRSTDLRCLLVVNGHATNISVGSQLLDTRLPAGTVPITDMRSPDQSALLRITNREIPSADSPLAVKGRQRRTLQLAAASKADRISAQNAGRSRLIVCLFIAFSVVPLVLFLRKKKGQPG